jgi:hypothetical protein
MRQQSHARHAAPDARAAAQDGEIMSEPSLSAAQAQPSPSTENLLLDYIHKLERHRHGRSACRIRLSLLAPANRREHHIRAALSTFDGLVRRLKGQVFALSNADIMVIFKDVALDEVQAALIKLRFLFDDDPSLMRESEEGQGFVEWYVVDKDYQNLLRLAQSLVNADIERRTSDQQAAAENEPPPRQKRREPFTPSLLAKMQAALAGADLANMMRRQAICALVGQAPPQPLFYELFVSIAELQQTLLPNVGIDSSPWLFQALTETLDHRVLALLNRQDDRSLSGDVSINLNVQTLLSPDFLVFDDGIRASQRGTIVIELQKVDIFADLGAFLFARDFARERGYRICIDGVTIDSLPFIDRGRLGIDLLKLAWHPSLVQGILPDGGALADYVRRCGPSRTILCRCDAANAITLGQSVGITLFQGRHVEHMLAGEQRIRGTMGRRRP